MADLDSLEQIQKLDKSGILDSIKQLPAQVGQAWQEVNSLDIPQACTLAKNVVVCGMGGSALGGRIVDSLLVDRVRTPIEVSTEFHLPKYVDASSFVILSSYSGGTEETLSVASEAFARGAAIFGVTCGGKLAEFLQKNNLSHYLIDPKANPSRQPRMGLGYSITAILAILARCQFIHLTNDEMGSVVNMLEKLVKEFDVPVNSHQNPAKSLAETLVGKIPVLIASGHLVGAVHAFKNQLNENAKTFATLFDMPEANHHLMEGLKNPALAKAFFHFLFFESENYAPEVSLRYPITREVVSQNEITSSVYKLTSTEKLDQIFEVLILGSFIGFYLAMLYDLDPAPIPWVDYFKSKL